MAELQFCFRYWEMTQCGAPWFFCGELDRDIAIVPPLTGGEFCGIAARTGSRLAQGLATMGNFPGTLAIENDAGYICDGLPYERRLNKVSINRRRQRVNLFSIKLCPIH